MTPEKLSQRLHREARELQQIYHQLIGVGTLRTADAGTGTRRSRQHRDHECKKDDRGHQDEREGD